MKAKRAVPTTFDGYLAALAPDQRSALGKLRRDIHASAPGAEECISYRMPGFRIDGRVLFWIGAHENHLSFYPGAVVQDLAAELADYETSKGTIRFSPSRPLPAALVRKIVRARMAQAARKSSRSPVPAARGRGAPRSSRRSRRPARH